MHVGFRSSKVSCRLLCFKRGFYSSQVLYKGFYEVEGVCHGRCS